MSLNHYNIPFDEDRIIDAIKSGETTLFGELISRYQDRIYNLAYRILGSTEDALDVTQETFIKAFKNINQFHRKSQFYTWLVRILITTTRDHKKNKVREQNTVRELQHILYQSQAGNLIRSADPAKKAESKEMVELFWQMVNLLDKEKREIFILREVEKLSYKEIAQLLNISIQAVKTRLFRAREHLRELLKPTIR